MSAPAGYTVRQLSEHDLALMDALLSMFGEVFGEPETYNDNRPDANYTRQLLGSDHFIALAALDGSEVVGGLTAYELTKHEQPRSEIYIYDLAVAERHRRRGIATALIEATRQLASERGAWVVFVQSDTGVEDEPAIALYSKLGIREDVLHFDIPTGSGDDD